MAKAIVYAAMAAGAAGAYTADRAAKERANAQRLQVRQQEVRAARERRKLINTARRNAANAAVMGEAQGGLGTSQQSAMSDQGTQAGASISFINQIQDYTARITSSNNSAAKWDMYGNVINTAGKVAKSALTGMG